MILRERPGSQALPKARFDPVLTVNNTFSRTSPPIAIFNPLDPRRALIEAFPTQSYNLNANVSKINSLGGTAQFGVNVTPSRTRSDLLPLNPQTTSNAALSYTQPLLQGAGLRANLPGKEVRYLAENVIRYRLAQIPGVAKVDVTGYQLKVTMTAVPQ